LSGTLCAWWRPGDGAPWPVCRAPGSHGARHDHRAPTEGGGRACHWPHAVGITTRKLHSVRLGRPRQAASVRGPSNQELKLHLAGGGGVQGRSAVATRRSLTPNALGPAGVRQTPKTGRHHNYPTTGTDHPATVDDRRPGQARQTRTGKTDQDRQDHRHTTVIGPTMAPWLHARPRVVRRGPPDGGGDGAGPRASAGPNTYEVPGCQETDYPCERIFFLFFRFFPPCVVTWQHVLT
jgi:hypothetical protein